jgi:hypothetical protein
MYTKCESIYVVSYMCGPDRLCAVHGELPLLV